MFTQCPSYEVDETDIPTLLDITIPTAKDNSGLEPIITVSPKDFTNPYLVIEVKYTVFHYELSLCFKRY